MTTKPTTDLPVQRTRRRSKLSDFWITRPISPTCEVIQRQGVCGQPTRKAYPAMGHGWMALCREHGSGHNDATPIEELLEKGEVLT